MGSFPIGAFDLILVGVLAVGVLRGRKHGMSEELLGLVKWLAILLVCAVAYQPMGNLFADSSRVLSKLTCYLMAYVAAALGVLILCAGIKRALAGTLLASDIFTSAEYYLGGGSGLVRFSCMLLAALARLN